MVKQFSYLFSLSVFLFSGVTFAQVQQAVKQQEAVQQQNASTPPQAIEQPKTEQSKEEIVKGIIRQIAPDGSYIVIGDTKILTTKEFIDDSYLEVDDNVEVAADKTDQGLKAKSCNYIFEEEGPSAIPEELPSGQDSSEGY